MTLSSYLLEKMPCTKPMPVSRAISIGLRKRAVSGHEISRITGVPASTVNKALQARPEARKELNENKVKRRIKQVRPLLQKVNAMVSQGYTKHEACIRLGVDHREFYKAEKFMRELR